MWERVRKYEKERKNLRNGEDIWEREREDLKNTEKIWERDIRDKMRKTERVKYERERERINERYR